MAEALTRSGDSAPLFVCAANQTSELPGKSGGTNLLEKGMSDWLTIKRPVLRDLQ
jgi:hypothetical protein